VQARLLLDAVAGPFVVPNLIAIDRKPAQPDGRSANRLLITLRNRFASGRPPVASANNPRNECHPRR
jgi:hypothetical protein